MKRIYVFAGNRFSEVEDHLLSLGYFYENGNEKISNIMACSLVTFSSGQMIWQSYEDNYEEAEVTTYRVEEILALTKEDVVELVAENKYAPFELVLINKAGYWYGGIFSHTSNQENAVLVGGTIVPYREIIPYKGNEDKIGKTVCGA